ncbi:MAG TPA: LecA/PA-IL family lectin [Anaerolineae bacterium]|nr:LecA/PA-IL family lectin [Anaerolineae bacterium]
MNRKSNDWGEKVRDWLLIVVAIVVGIVALIFRDDLKTAIYAWGVAIVIALAWWYARIRKWSTGWKWAVLMLVIVVGTGWGYLLWRTAQPRFEITALDTLDRDRNAYELTDQLIWNADDIYDQVRYGVTITFTLEIRPEYNGTRRLGRVVALISGDSGNRPRKRLLWADFTSESSTQQIQLTLSELLDASGLQVNSDRPTNPFRPGDFPFQQARLIVQIAREADLAHPWASEEITVRNAPWDQRSALVQRNGRRELDIYVKNLGGAGGFTVRYRLVQLGRDIGTSSLPEVSGATTVTSWNEPKALIYLEKGEFFTDTVSVPDQLAQGRYLLEAYAVKKQNYVQFEDPGTRWENLNSMNSPWWFGGYPPDEQFFVVTTPEFEIDPTAQAEWKRLKDGGIFDLGLVTGPVEDVTSASGTVGLRQVFQNGEVYVHDSQAYAIYGSILEHYQELGGVQNERLGFPRSSIQTVTSISGITGEMMEFEGQGSPHPPTSVYSSTRGIAVVWQWIGLVYSAENGGHSGWLGFPLADESSFPDSTIQTFENGYIAFYYPYANGERDWTRPPVAYPYLGSRGTLFDVQASQMWQDTGVQVQQGDRVTIVQVGGTWTHAGPGVWYDANGYAGLGPDPHKGTLLPLANTGALIGKIGENLFLVGRWSVLTAPADGTLHLAMNDDKYDDNDGLITVQIMVED